MMYRNYRHKLNRSKTTIKISYIIGFVLLLFLFIWKMPVIQNEVVRDIQITDAILR